MSAALLSELARVKAIFQLRAIQTVMGFPHSKTCGGIPFSWNPQAGEGAALPALSTNPARILPDATGAGEGTERLARSPALSPTEGL